MQPPTGTIAPSCYCRSSSRCSRWLFLQVFPPAAASQQELLEQQVEQPEGGLLPASERLEESAPSYSGLGSAQKRSRDESSTEPDRPRGNHQGNHARHWPNHWGQFLVQSLAQANFNPVDKRSQEWIQPWHEMLEVLRRGPGPGRTCQDLQKAIWPWYARTGFSGVAVERGARDGRETR